VDLLGINDIINFSSTNETNDNNNIMGENKWLHLINIFI
jgi:hypothetical protein